MSESEKTMFLPVNKKTVLFSVFVLAALLAAGRLLPAEAWDFVRNNNLAIWVIGLAILYALYNIVAGLLIWLIVGSSEWMARQSNPEVGRVQHEIMDGQVTHETVLFQDGSERHYFHYDPDRVSFDGGGG